MKHRSSSINVKLSILFVLIMALFGSFCMPVFAEDIWGERTISDTETWGAEKYMFFWDSKITIKEQGTLIIDGTKNANNKTSVGFTQAEGATRLIVDGGTLILQNVSMWGARATAIECKNGGKIEINDSNLQDNGHKKDNNDRNSAVNGGVINATGCTIEIKDTQFNNNVAKNGGSLYLNKSTLTLENIVTKCKNNTPLGHICTDDDKKLNEAFEGKGGLVYAANGSTVTIKNSEITKVSAKNGGAGYVEDGTLTGGIMYECVKNTDN